MNRGGRLSEARLGGYATHACGNGVYCSQSKSEECVPSRRSTAMSALGLLSGLIHGYQSDSSSKSPLSTFPLGSLANIEDRLRGA